jgi:hypothetical protein
MKKLKHKKIHPATCRHVLQLSGLAAATCTLLSGALTAKAATYSGSETLADFGTKLNQNSATYVDPTVGGENVGPNACVPTAVAQGLSYLYTQDAGAFTVSPNNTTAIDALASAMTTAQNPITGNYGTTYPNRVTGTTSYLTTANPSTAYVVSGQYDASYLNAPTFGPTYRSAMGSATTASFLANGLNSDWGVEFAIRWGTLAGNVFTSSGGGHFVTLQSISFDTTTGTGEISFIDPGDAAYVQDASLSVTSGGNLYVSYPAPTEDVDDDEGEAAGLDGVPAVDPLGGVIINDLAETIPDGGLTAGLLGGSVVGLLALRRRYSFSA